MELCADVFGLNVAEASTSKNGEKKHKHAMQKYFDAIEQKNLPLKENLRIKLGLKT